MSGKDRQRLLAGDEARGERLDLFLVRSLPGASRKAIKRALDEGRVLVDGVGGLRAGRILQGGETVLVTLELSAAEAAPPALPVLWRDGGLLAVDKPAGLPAHPTVAGRANALDLLRSLLAEENIEPILLHRLDADTTGVLLFALTPAANRSLARQFAEREVTKTYLALVAGSPPDAFGVRNHLKAGVRGRTVAARSGGQPAETAFRTLERHPGFALVEAAPRTGRTHQIRAHLGGEGYPLLGDTLYGGPAFLSAGDRQIPLRRHLLHAFRLTFRHPVDGRLTTIETPMPVDFKAVLSD